VEGDMYNVDKPDDRSVTNGPVRRRSWAVSQLLITKYLLKIRSLHS
jgi:hypothetical protein